jgi:hypothetical protein
MLKSIKDGQQVARKMADLHADIQGHFNDTDLGHRDMNRGEAAMTLRNFNAAIAIIEQGGCNLMDACTVVYLAQLTRNKGARLHSRIEPLGTKSRLGSVRSKIENLATELQIFATEEFLDAAVSAAVAANSGLNVLLEGPTGRASRLWQNSLLIIPQRQTQGSHQHLFPIFLKSYWGKNQQWKTFSVRSNRRH